MLRQKRQRPKHVNTLAHHLVDVSIQEGTTDVALPTKAQVSMLMAEFGRKGGKIGGKRRLETMSSTQRKDIARRAAEARWKNK